MKNVMRHTVIAALLMTAPLSAQANGSCNNLPDYPTLQRALHDAAAQQNGGLNLPVWGTIVDRSGLVCAVAFSGPTEEDQWPASRIISAEKATTANAFSLPGLALSTANLYAATQPGGPMFGLQAGSPVNILSAYSGDVADFGTEKDPMLKNRIGGVSVFGGGLALYDAKGAILGGLGISGDSSCADHNTAWRVRSELKLDYVPSGMAAGRTDQIIYDFTGGRSVSGWGHPTCAGTEAAIAATLPPVEKVKQP